MEKTRSFLRRSKPRKKFGNEIELGIIALSIGMGLGYVKKHSSDPESEARNLSYSTLQEAEEAYRKAIDYYKPSFYGEPIQNIIPQLIIK